MKGVTNAMESVITVKTGVTVEMLQSIPEDTPWDLTLEIMTDKDLDRYILHGVGPVPKTEYYNEIPIVGMHHHFSKSSNQWVNQTGAQLHGALITSTNLLQINYTSGSAYLSSSKTISETDLSSATLYLYGGGDSDLLKIGTSLYAEVSA